MHRYGVRAQIFIIPQQYIMAHFRDESFQSVSCTGTDNQTKANQRKHKRNTTVPT